jgi:multisubunit Na+/H+ antiporter MnhG subunit
MIEIIGNIIAVFGVLIISACVIGFLKTKNLFLSVKLAFILNIYGVSILLIGLFLQNPSIALALKMALLVAINIMITIIINHLIIKKNENNAG